MILRYVEADLNSAIIHSHGIRSNRLAGGLPQDTAVSNIETGTMQGANEAICPQAPSFQLRHGVRAFVLDGEESILSVTDQDVMAGYLV